MKDVLFVLSAAAFGVCGLLGVLCLLHWAGTGQWWPWSDGR